MSGKRSFLRRIRCLIAATCIARAAFAQAPSSTLLVRSVHQRLRAVPGSHRVRAQPRPHTVSAVNSQQGEYVADQVSQSHKPPYSAGLRKTPTIVRNMAIPTTHNVRQAIQPSASSQLVFVEWVTDLILVLIRHRLDSSQPISLHRFRKPWEERSA